MKKAISLALLTAIILSTFSCTEKVPAWGGTVTTSSDDTSTDAVTTDIYSALPEKDFGETEINILSYNSSYGKRDEFLYAEQTGDVVDDALFKRNLETENRLGVKLVYDDANNENDAIKLFTNTVLAGDDSFDTFAFKVYALGSIFTKGVLRSWDGIEGYDLSNPWYVKDANETFTIGNKQFMIFSDALATNMTCAWAFSYNKRLAEEWKITGLNEIVREGKWTLDKLGELTKNIYSDTNGDGKPDVDDIYGLYLDVGGPLDAFMLTNGIHALEKNKDDYPEVCFYSERLVESFEKCYSLLYENTGSCVVLRNQEDNFYDYIKKFAEGHGVFSPMFIQYLMEDTMRSMSDEYGVLPFPKLTEDQEYMTYVLPRHGGFMLPKTLTEEKAGMIGYVVECLSAYSYKELRPAIYDVALTTKGVRDEESVEMIDLILDSRRYDFVGALQYGGSFVFTQDKTYRNLLAAKNKDITSFYESNKSAADKYIEDLVKQLENVD